MAFLDAAEQDRLEASNYVDAVIASTMVEPYLEMSKLVKSLVNEFVTTPSDKITIRDLKYIIRNSYLRAFETYSWDPLTWSQENVYGMLNRGVFDAASWIMEQAPAIQKEQILGKYFFQPDSFQPITDEMAESLFNAIADSIDEDIDYYENTFPITGELAAEKLKSSIDDDIAMGMFWLANMGSWSMWNAYTNGIFDIISILPTLIGGWMWWAILDSKTCASCIVLHGTIFSATESLLDHPHGRCIPIPIVASNYFTDNGIIQPPLDIETGEQWFSSQSAETQSAILGPSGYRAWNSGAASLSDFSETHDHFLYGSFKRQASLSSILGEHKARAYYGQ